jgi:hypothetical protein
MLLAVVVYFLPTIIAGCRGRAEGSGGIFLLNLFLGWTAIGWLVAFI